MPKFSTKMKPILRGWFDEFEKDWFPEPAKAKNDEDYRFECFCNYYVINSMQGGANNPPDDYATSEGPTDKSDDFHIDGVGVFVNGILCSTIDELNATVEKSSKIEVTVHFLQAKNGADDLNAGSLNSFLEAASQFISDEPWGEEFLKENQINEHIVEAQTVFAESLSKKFTSKPRVHLHWCVSQRERGKEFRNDVAATVTNRIKKLAKEHAEFASMVDFDFYGASDLAEIADSFGHQNKCTFELGGNPVINFPAISDELEDSFFAFIPGEEFLNIICPDGETIDHKLFNENVRDFLGEESDPFKGMTQTLSSPDEREYFSFRNNGVTVVAGDITGNSRKKTLYNYQIVNGCQTSNALFENREHLEDVFVPVRCIKTKDSDVLDSITLSTNSQNSVTASDMASRTKSARELERVCKRDDVANPIAFERREGQFIRIPTKVPKNRILKKKDFTSAYVSCVLKKPHHGIGYWDRYQNGKKDDIWLSDAPTSLLYLSGYLMNAIIRNKLFGEYSSLKFHFGTAAFNGLWPDFDQIFAMYNSAENSEEKVRIEKRINDGVDKVLKEVDQKNILEKKLEPALQAASKLAVDSSVLDSKSGKLGRANTKTEVVTHRFFSLMEKG